MHFCVQSCARRFWNIYLGHTLSTHTDRKDSESAIANRTRMWSLLFRENWVSECPVATAYKHSSTFVNERG